MKKLIYLFVLLSVWTLNLKAQDIDFPLSQSEIEKYESRVRIQRLPNVAVTHPDAYKIRTQQPVYSPSTKRITLDVINVDAPTAEPEYHRMKHWKDGKSCLCWCRQGFVQRRYITRTYINVRVQISAETEQISSSLLRVL